MSDKNYVLTKAGSATTGPHIFTNADDASDVLAMCACGKTKNTEGKCDGSHLKKEEEGGCCGGGHCCGE